MIKVVFVCLGNICRSPMAAAIFSHMVRQAGLESQIEVDSSGTGSWHVGEPPHPGTREVLRRNNISYSGYARQITANDLRTADYLISMDSDNVDTLHRLDRERIVDGKVARLLDFAPEARTRDVPDPYYEGNFNEVYKLVEAGCQGLLEHIRSEHNL